MWIALARSRRDLPANVRDRKLALVRRSISVMLLTLLTVAVSSLPQSGAAFVGTTTNTGNSVGSDTLDPPTSFTAADGVTIALDWTATVDTYASGHRIFRSTTSGGPYTQVAEVTPRGTVTYDDGAPEGRHYYVARSFFGAWESAATSEVTARAWRAFDCPSDPDLRLCVKFDTDLGGTFADHSTYGNTVTHTGAVQVEGISDKAVIGSPTATYEVADSASLDITAALTMEGWVRFDSLPSTGRVGLIDNDGQYSVFYYSTGMRCSNGLNALPHVLLTSGSWIHFACVWDGSDLTLYIDGSPVGTMASSGTIDTANTNPIALLDSSPDFDEPLDGAMDNVRIWSSARTQAQICADAGLTC